MFLIFSFLSTDILFSSYSQFFFLFDMLNLLVLEIHLFPASLGFFNKWILVHEEFGRETVDCEEDVYIVNLWAFPQGFICG